MKKQHLLIAIYLFLIANSPACADTNNPIKSTLNMSVFPGFETGKNKTDIMLTGYKYQATEGATIKPGISFYSELPAIVKPLLQHDKPNQLSNKTLGNYMAKTKISLEKNSNAKIINSEDEIYVTLLAQGDFTHDGIEDLLIKTEWYARKIFGKHADLLILTSINQDIQKSADQY
ncbi:MAG: hypothetical protein GXP18_01225 [Gammaproteobacteria bacterium]|nr:hypothetical protein [Gammaproteobacteria bacterium]